MNEAYIGYEQSTTPSISDELGVLAQSVEQQPEPTYQCTTREEYEAKLLEYNHQHIIYNIQLNAFHILEQENKDFKLSRQINEEIVSGVLKKETYAKSSIMLFTMRNKEYIIDYIFPKRDTKTQKFAHEDLFAYESIDTQVGSQNIFDFFKEYNNHAFAYIQGKQVKVLPDIRGFDVYISTGTDQTYGRAPKIVPIRTKPGSPDMSKPLPPKTPKPALTPADKKPTTGKKTHPVVPKEKTTTPAPIDTTTSVQKTKTHAYNIGGTVTSEGVIGGARVTKEVYDLYTNKYTKEKNKKDHIKILKKTISLHI